MLKCKRKRVQQQCKSPSWFDTEKENTDEPIHDHFSKLFCEASEEFHKLRMFMKSCEQKYASHENADELVNQEIQYFLEEDVAKQLLYDEHGYIGVGNRDNTLQSSAQIAEVIMPGILNAFWQSTEAKDFMHPENLQEDKGGLPTKSPLQLDIWSKEADVKAANTMAFIGSDSKDKTTSKKTSRPPQSTLVPDEVAQAVAITEGDGLECTESHSQTLLHETTEDFPKHHGHFDKRKEGERTRKSTAKSVHDHFSKLFYEASEEFHKLRMFMKSCEQKYTSHENAAELVNQEIQYFLGEDVAKQLLYDEHGYVGVGNRDNTLQSSAQIAEVIMPGILNTFWQSTEAKDFMHPENLQEDKGGLPTKSPLHLDIWSKEADVKAANTMAFIGSDSKDKTTSKKTSRPPQSTLIPDEVAQAVAITEGDVLECRESHSQASLQETTEDFPTHHGHFDKRKEGGHTDKRTDKSVHDHFSKLFYEASEEFHKLRMFMKSCEQKYASHENADELVNQEIQYFLEEDVAKQLLYDEHGYIGVDNRDNTLQSSAQVAEVIMPGILDAFRQSTEAKDFMHPENLQEDKGGLPTKSPLHLDIWRKEAKDVKAASTIESSGSDSKYETKSKITAVAPPESPLVPDEVAQAVAIMEKDILESRENLSEILYEKYSQTSLHETFKNLQTDQGVVAGKLTIHSPLTPDILGAQAEDGKAVCSPGSVDSDSKDETTKRKSTESPVAPPESILIIDEVAQAVSIMEGEVPEHAESPSQMSLHETIEDFPTDHRDLDDRKEVQHESQSPLTPDIVDVEAEDGKAVCSPGSIDSDSKDETTERKTTESPVAPPESIPIIDEVAQAVSIMEGEVPEYAESPSQTSLLETTEDFPTHHGHFDKRKEGEHTAKRTDKPIHDHFSNIFCEAYEEFHKLRMFMKSCEQKYASYKDTDELVNQEIQYFLEDDDAKQLLCNEHGYIGVGNRDDTLQSSAQIAEVIMPGILDAFRQSTEAKDFIHPENLQDDKGKLPTKSPLHLDIRRKEAENVEASSIIESIDSESKYETRNKTTSVAPPESIPIMDEVAQAVAIMEKFMLECRESLSEMLNKESSQTSLAETIKNLQTDQGVLAGKLTIHSPMTPDILGAQAKDGKAVCSPGSVDSDSKDETTKRKTTESPVAPPESIPIIDEVAQAVSIMEGEVPEHAESARQISLHETIEDFATDHGDLDDRKEVQLKSQSPLTPDILDFEAEDGKTLYSPGSMDSDSKDGTTKRKTTESPVAPPESIPIIDEVAQAVSIMEGEVPEHAESPSQISLHKTIEDFPTDHRDLDDRKEVQLKRQSPLTPDILGDEAEDGKAVCSPGSVDSDSKDGTTERKTTESPVAPPESILIFDEVAQAVSIMEGEVPEHAESPRQISLHETIEDFATDHRDLDDRKEVQLKRQSPLTPDMLDVEAEDGKAVYSPQSMDYDSKDETAKTKTTESPVAPPESIPIIDEVPQAIAIMEGEVPEHAESPSQISFHETIEDFATDHRDLDDRKEVQLKRQSPLTPDILGVEAEDGKAVCSLGSVDYDSKDETTIRKTTESPVAPPESIPIIDEVAQAVSIMEGEVPEYAESPSQISLHETIEDFPTDHRDLDDRKEVQLKRQSPLTPDILGGEAEDGKAVCSPGSIDSDSKDEKTERKTTESPVAPPESIVVIAQVSQAVSIMEGEVPEYAESPSMISLLETIEDFPTDHRDLDDRKEDQLKSQSPLTPDILGVEAEDGKAVCSPGSVDSDRKDETTKRKTTESPVAPPESILIIDEVPQAVSIMEGEVPEHAESPSMISLLETIEDFPTDHRDLDDRKEDQLKSQSPLTPDILDVEAEDGKTLYSPGSMDSDRKDETTKRKTTESPVAPPESIPIIDEVAQAVAIMEGEVPEHAESPRQISLHETTEDFATDHRDLDDRKEVQLKRHSPLTPDMLDVEAEDGKVVCSPGSIDSDSKDETTERKTTESPVAPPESIVVIAQVSQAVSIMEGEVPEHAESPSMISLLETIEDFPTDHRDLDDRKEVQLKSQSPLTPDILSVEAEDGKAVCSPGSMDSDSKDGTTKRKSTESPVAPPEFISIIDEVPQAVSIMEVEVPEHAESPSQISLHKTIEDFPTDHRDLDDRKEVQIKSQSPLTPDILGAQAEDGKAVCSPGSMDSDSKDETTERKTTESPVAPPESIPIIDEVAQAVSIMEGEVPEHTESLSQISLHETIEDFATDHRDLDDRKEVQLKSQSPLTPDILDVDAEDGKAVRLPGSVDYDSKDETTKRKTAESPVAFPESIPIIDEVAQAVSIMEGEVPEHTKSPSQISLHETIEDFATDHRDLDDRKEVQLKSQSPLTPDILDVEAEDGKAVCSPGSVDSDRKDETTERKTTESPVAPPESILIIDEVAQAVSIMEGEVPEYAESPSQTSLHETIEDFATDHRDLDDRKEVQLKSQSPLTPDILGAQAEDGKVVCSPGSVDSDSKDETTKRKTAESPVAPPESIPIIDEVTQAVAIMEGEVPEHTESPSQISLHETIEDFATDHRDLDDRKEVQLKSQSPLTPDILDVEAEDGKAVYSPGSIDSDRKDETTIRKTAESPVAFPESIPIIDEVAQAVSIMEGEVPEYAESPSQTSLHETIEDFATDHRDLDDRKEVQLKHQSPLTPDILGVEAEDGKAVCSLGSVDYDSKDETTIRKTTESPVAPPESILIIDEVPQAVSIMEGEVPEHAESPSQISLHETIEDFATDHRDLDDRKEVQHKSQSPLTPDILGVEAEDGKAVCLPGSVDYDSKDETTIRKTTESPVAPPESIPIIDEVPQAVAIMEGEVPEHAESPSQISLHKTIEDFPTDHRDLDDRKEGQLKRQSPLTPDILSVEAEDGKAVCSLGSMDSDSKDGTTERKTTESPVAPPESIPIIDEVSQAVSIMEGEVPEHTESPSMISLLETIEDFPTDHRDLDDRKEVQHKSQSPLTPDILGVEAEDGKVVCSPGSMDSDSKDGTTKRKTTESPVAPPESIPIIDEVAQAVSIMEGEVPEPAESPSQISLHETIEDFATDHKDLDDRKEVQLKRHSPLTPDILGGKAEDGKAVCSPGSMYYDSKDGTTERKTTESPVAPPESILIFDEVAQAVSIMEGEVPEHAESLSQTSLLERTEDFAKDHRDLDDRKEVQLKRQSPLTPDMLDVEAEDGKVVCSPGSMDSDSKDGTTERKTTESPVAFPESIPIIDEVAQAIAIMEGEVPEHTESPSQISLHETIEDFVTDHRDLDDRKEVQLKRQSPLTPDILGGESEDGKIVCSPESIDSDSKDETTKRKITESPVAPPEFIPIIDEVAQAITIMEGEVPEHTESPSQISLHETIEDFATDHGDLDDRKEVRLKRHSPLTPDILGVEAEDGKAVCSPGSVESDSKDETTKRKTTESPVAPPESIVVIDEVSQAVSIMEGEVPEYAESPSMISLLETIEDFPTDHRDLDDRKEVQIKRQSPLTLDILGAQAEDGKAVCSPGSVDSYIKDETTKRKTTESPVAPPESIPIIDEVAQAIAIMEGEVPEHAESPSQISLHETIEDFATDHRDLDDRKEVQLKSQSPLTPDILDVEAEDGKAVYSPGSIDSDRKDETTKRKTTESPVAPPESIPIIDEVAQAVSIMEGEVPEYAESPSQISLHETIEDFATDHRDLDDRKEVQLKHQSPLTPDILGVEAEDGKAVCSLGSVDYDSKDETTIRKTTESPVAPPESILIIDEVAQAVSIMEGEVPEHAESPRQISLHETIEDFVTDHRDLDDRKEVQLKRQSPLTPDILGVEAEDGKAVYLPGSMDYDSKDGTTERKTTESPVAPPESIPIIDEVAQAVSIMEGEVPEHAESPSQISLHETIEDFPTDHRDLDDRKEVQHKSQSPLTPDILGVEAEDGKAVCLPGSVDSDSKDETTIRKTTESPVAPPEFIPIIDEVAQAVSIMEEEVPEHAESPSQTSLHKTIEDFPTDHGDLDEIKDRKEGEYTSQSPLTPEPETLYKSAQSVKLDTMYQSMQILEPETLHQLKQTVKCDNWNEPMQTVEPEISHQFTQTLEPDTWDQSTQTTEPEISNQSTQTVSLETHHHSMQTLEPETLHRSTQCATLDTRHQSMQTLEPETSNQSTQCVKIDTRHQSMQTLEPETSHQVTQTLEPDTRHQSMQTLEPETLHRSMQTIKLETRHQSMQTLEPETSHQSTQTLEPDTWHQSMQTLEPETLHQSMQTVKLETRHQSMQTLEPETSHQSTQTLEPDTRHQSMQTLEPETSHQVTQTLEPDTRHQSMQTLEPETSHQFTQTLEPDTWLTQTDAHHQYVNTLIDALISRAANQSKLCPSEFLKNHLLEKILAEIKGNDLNITTKRVKHLDKVIVRDICKSLFCKDKDLLGIMNLMDPKFDKVIVSTFSTHLLALSEIVKLNSSGNDDTYTLSLETCVDKFVKDVLQHSDRICNLKEADAIVQRLFIKLWTQIQGKHDKIPLENFNNLSTDVYKDLCKRWGSPRAILMSMQLNLPQHDKIIVKTFIEHLMKSKEQGTIYSFCSRISQKLGVTGKKNQ